MIKTQMNIKDELFNKKFKNDNIYKFLSKKYATLDDHKKMINNNILMIVLEELIPIMKDSDDLFKKMSRGCMYGGSYYKRLKVIEPNEYDINLIMKLPINYCNLKKETENCKPGYIKIKVTDKCHLNYKHDKDVWSLLLDDDLYLDQNKFRNWMQSVLVKSLNAYTENGGRIELGGDFFTINYRQSNPAFTLQIKRNDGDELDVDLVPCLMFHDKTLAGFTRHGENSWITIAKPLRSERIQQPNLLWRVGFYRDEKEMLKGQIKPIIRLMKVFRNARDWQKLKSYFIETVFLHELQNEEFLKHYQSASRTCLFVYMLKRFKEILISEKILNYWHSNHNLLENISKPTLTCIANELHDIIHKIENNPEDILKYFKIV